jgi:hypothetical protein
MRAEELNSLAVPDLVKRFKDLALVQYQAELLGDTSKYNRLYAKIVAIKDELKRRQGDQRAALVSLFEHPNPQVRLMAAQWALAVRPEAAQRALRQLSEQNEYPQAAHARQSLSAIERGDSKLLERP